MTKIKMASPIPTTLTNAMAAVASLREFVRLFFRLSICISLAFINCLFRVAFLPAMNGLRLLFEVENYHDHR